MVDKITQSVKIRKAYVIKTDGTRIDLDHQPTLSEAQQLVGGYVERLASTMVRIPKLTFFGDEEGKLKGKLINRKVSDLLSYNVVGNILILEGWKTFSNK